MSTTQHESSTTEFSTYAKEVFAMIRQRGADLLSGETDGDLGFRVAVAGTEDYLRHLIGGRRRDPMCEKGLAIQWATAEDVCAGENERVAQACREVANFWRMPEWHNREGFVCLSVLTFLTWTFQGVRAGAQVAGAVVQ